MPDIATLGIAVKSDQAEKGAKRLDQLSGAAKRAEAATHGLASASNKATQIAANTARSTEVLSGALRREQASANSSAAALNARSIALMRAGSATKMAANQQRNLLFQLNDVGVSLASGMSLGMVAIQQGSQISQIYGPGEGGLGRALKETGKLALGAAAAFPLLTAAVGVGAAAFAGMRYEINKTSKTQVSFQDVALASLQVVRDGIYNMLKPAIDAVSPWFAAAWDQVTMHTKALGNNLVRGVLGAFEIIKFGIKSLPDAFLAAGEAAAQGFLNAIISMAREVMVTVNLLITKINYALGKNGFETQIANLGKPDAAFPSLKVNFGGAAARDRLSKGYNGLDTRAGEIAKTDYMGQFYNAVSAQAIKNALADLEKDGKKAGDALKKAANDNIDPWEGLRNVSERVKEQMAALEERTKAVDGAWRSFGEGANGIIDGLISGTMSWRDALKSAIPVVKDLLLNLMNANNPSGFGGGWLGSLLGGLTGLGGGYAGGGNLGYYPPMPKFAAGGVTNQPSIFGDAGPEAAVPLPDGRHIPVKMMSGGTSSHQGVHVTVGWASGSDGDLKPVIRSVSREVANDVSATHIDQYNRQVLPGRVNQINEDPHARG